MDVRLNSFLQRAESVLERIEPLLPAERVALDWSTVIAARWPLATLAAETGPLGENPTFET